VNTFRILHISDLHLCTEPNRYNFYSLTKRTPSAKIDAAYNIAKSAVLHGPLAAFRPASFRPSPLAALAEFVFDRRASYAGIVISGDLSTSGLGVDLEVAFRFVDMTPNDLWYYYGGPVLSADRRPLILLPGNQPYSKFGCIWAEIWKVP
jgi:3',5'-cyclic AMP phosphodiesterase CpdA